MVPIVAGICTDKTEPRSLAILENAVWRLLAQSVDEIVLVQNHKKKPEPHEFTTSLYLEKSGEYMVATCGNLALDYLEEKYRRDFVLLTLADDILVSGNYVDAMTSGLDEGIVRVPCGQFLTWPVREDFEDNFEAGFALEEPLKDLRSVTENLHRIGDGIYLSGFFSVRWIPALRGTRYDENYNGHWGYEDSDFMLQLMEKGCELHPCTGGVGWHISTAALSHDSHLPHHWKVRNNPNFHYFNEKWTGRE